MIASLRGSLIAKLPHYIVIEVSGMGFRVWMPSSSLLALEEIGNEVFILTSLQIRENEMTLYGFLTEGEREIFEKLLSVSGVGPKIALAALSSYSAHCLANLIMCEDADSLAKISGIGKKTAQRIILELRSSFSQSMPAFSDEPSTPVFGSEVMVGAREILSVMGFTSQEIEQACKGYDGERQNSDALVRYALRRLGE